MKNFWPLPLLNFKDIWRFIFSTTIGPTENIFWVRSSSNSIAIICDHIAKISGNNNVTLHLPAYFCGNSLRNLRSLDINLSFYPLNDFQPDYTYIKELDKNDGVNVMLFVHYFGKIGDQLECKEFCAINNFILIEDCAHIVDIDFNINWVGDYVIFSPHKHYPVPEVGIIKSKQNLKLRPEKFGFSILWISKQFLRIFIKYRRRSSFCFIYDDKVEDVNYKTANKAVVKFTLLCLVYRKKDLRQRRNNIRILSSIMLQISNWSPLLDFSETEYPYIYGFLCDNEEMAKKRFDILNERIPLVLQWTNLPREVLNSDFDCIEVMKKTIFFVVHGRIDSHLWVRELLVARNKIFEIENQKL